MKSLRTLALAAALTAPFAASANLLTNGSFENGAYAPVSNQTMTLSPGSTAMTGWSVITDAVAWIGAGNPWGLTAPDGNRFLDLTDYSAGAPFGGVAQTFATTVGTPYLVSFFLGSSTTYGRPSGVMVSAAGSSQTFTSPLTGGTNDWEQRTMSFVATGTTTTLSFAGSSGYQYIGLDNVSVTAVPEPASALLMLIGAGLVFGLVRRKQAPANC